MALSDFIAYPVAAGKKVLGKTITGVTAQAAVLVDETHEPFGTDANPLYVSEVTE